MMKVVAVVFLLLCWACPTLAAEWEGVFEGSLGKAKIIVELNAGPDKTEYKGGFRRWLALQLPA